MEALGFSTEGFGVGNHDIYNKAPVSNFEMHRAPLVDGKLIYSIDQIST